MPFLNRLSGLTFSDFERNLESEPALIAEITEKMLLVQANAAARQKRAVARGTHAKGVCARAKFEVFDVSVGRDPALGERLARGIYAKRGIYPAIVRFANGDPNVNSDFKADLRALSFSVELPPGGGTVAGANVSRQDYSMQNAARFIINDARAFLPFAKVLSASSLAKGALSLSWQEKLIFARILAIALRQAHQPLKPYQQLRYWSQVPFRHGSTDVVKYSATPSADNPARALQKNNPNALQDELRRHLNEDTKMSAFDFALQFLDTERMTYRGMRRDASFWIENASVEWQEQHSPFHPVARLTLVPKSELPKHASESLYFDVTGNSESDTAPVGSINRTRCPAEIASRKARIGRLT
jgi:hypothetical protein